MFPKFETALELTLYKASFCRAFETKVQEYAKKGVITCPIYLSLGQEILAAVISGWYPDAVIFAQHRSHSTYLCFGGNPEELILKLIKSPEGSASIQIKGKMFGHSGLMGDQVPIATGYALRSTNPVLTFMGDASAEEDYVLGAIGFASTHKLPILFVVEDNNLSILTEKRVRRNWNMHDIGKAFKLSHSIEVDDSISELNRVFDKIQRYLPSLINVKTNRICWHAGTGNNEGIYDRLSDEIKGFENIREQAIKDNNDIWEKALQKL